MYNVSFFFSSRKVLTHLIKVKLKSFYKLRAVNIVSRKVMDHTAVSAIQAS